MNIPFQVLKVLRCTDGLVIFINKFEIFISINYAAIIKYQIYVVTILIVHKNDYKNSRKPNKIPLGCT